jgi:hypothetical protein
MTITVFILMTLFLTLQVKGQTDYGDIILSGQDSLTITGSATCFNLTITDDATLVLENAYLQIDGIVRLSENARLFVIRSTLRLSPPALDQSTHVLHATESATINVREGSSVLFEPQPVATNISYMLLEDETSFYIADSTFSGDLPTIINQSIVTASVTAGVYLLSGQASWHIKNSYVTGELSLDITGLTGRWFWCSLHQRSTLTIENTDLELTSLSASKTMIKPVSGLVIIKNSRMLGGEIEAEVAAELSLVNTSFKHQVKLKDQTKADISNCTFERDVTIGSALEMVEVLKAPETEVQIRESTIDGKLTCMGNSTTIIEDTDIRSLTMYENASLDMTGSTLEGFTSLSMYNATTANITDTHITGLIKVYRNSFLNYEGPDALSRIDINGTCTDNNSINVFLKATEVNELLLFPISENTILIDNVTINNASYYDTRTDFQCVNSTIEVLFPKTPGVLASLNFTLVDSTIPELTEGNGNTTFNILHRLGLVTRLNGMPVSLNIIVRDESGGEWIEKSTDNSLIMDLPIKKVCNQNVTITMNYTAEASYLGFSESRKIQLTGSKTVLFDWEDRIAPTVTDIMHEPDQWNRGKDIIIRARVTDKGVESIASVILVYRIDGREWQNMSMFRIGEDIYETAVPGQEGEHDVTYFLSALDMAQNQVNTTKKSFTIGKEENLLLGSSLLIMLCVVIVIVGKKVVNHRKIKRYAEGYEAEGGRK